ncbi:MAF1 [Candida pseudojiufengensis]|uniref:MAF1 n=1 Tax=Candida pseudojiufengensis TaxID=497109 RepID=UPI0022247CE0|nr:MAF1 [Candida pseudojiufengensis]KAI5965145.1 MAF1 [Candida pseudojiufengensis]
MKYIDEIDLELVNQELNFKVPDNNLSIRGGCELFTTKPIGSDRKLFKTIDKHLNQIIEDNELSRSLEKERQSSIGSLFGISGSPIDIRINNNQFINERKRRSSSNSGKLNFQKNSITSNTTDDDTASNTSLLSKSLNNDDSIIEPQDVPIDESPFGPLKSTSTRRTFAYLIAILNNTFPDQDFSSLQPTYENFYKIETSEDLIQKFNNLLISLGKKEDILNWIWDIINSYMEVIPSKNSSPYLSGLSGSPTDTNGHNYNHSNSRKNSINNNSRNGSYSTLTGVNGISSNSPPSSNSNSNSNSPYENCQIYQFQPSDESIFEDLTYPHQPMWSYYWFIYNRKRKRVTFLHLTAIQILNFDKTKRNSKDSKGDDNELIHDEYYDDDEEYDENDEYINNNGEEVEEDDDDDDEDDDEFDNEQEEDVEKNIIDEENADVVGDLEI